MQLNYNSQNAQGCGWRCASFSFPSLAQFHTVSSLVYPFCPFRCFACVNVHGVLAFLAADSTAPVELALTFGNTCHSGGVITSATAHDFTPISPT